MKFRDLGVTNLSLEISTNCNIRCSFCPIDQRSAPPRYLKLGQITPILDQLAEDGSLDLVGFQFLNEPLLHPDIEAILTYAHQVGLRTFVSTNGTILNQRIIDILACTSPTKMKISVQDVNPRTFKVVKGTKMSYEEFRERVANFVHRRLTDAQFRTKVEIDIAVPIRDGGRIIRRRSWFERALGVTFTDQTINDGNHELLQHIREFLRYLEAEAHAPIAWERFNPDLYNIKTWTEDYVPTARIGPGITLELKAFYDWIGIDRKLPVTYGSCERLNHVVINYKGDFQLCCADTHGKTAIGNIFERSLQEILAKPSNLAKLLRAPGHELPTEHCRRCKGAPTRRGVAILNLMNRLRNRYPRFISEAQRDSVTALQQLRVQECATGQTAVVAAINETLQRRPEPLSVDVAVTPDQEARPAGVL